jgi:hypothetical protein
MGKTKQYWEGLVWEFELGLWKQICEIDKRFWVGL